MWSAKKMWGLVYNFWIIYLLIYNKSDLVKSVPLFNLFWLNDVPCYSASTVKSGWHYWNQPMDSSRLLGVIILNYLCDKNALEKEIFKCGADPKHVVSPECRVLKSSYSRSATPNRTAKSPGPRRRSKSPGAGRTDNPSTTETFV